VNNNSQDAFHAQAAEMSTPAVGDQSSAKRPSSDRMSVKCDGQRAPVNVRWTVVDKGQLVELVDQLTNVPGDLPDGTLQSEPFVAADVEPPQSRRRGLHDAPPSGDVDETGRRSALDENFERNLLGEDAVSARARRDDQRAPVGDEATPMTVDVARSRGPGDHDVTAATHPATSSSAGVTRDRGLAVGKTHRSRRTSAVRRTNGLVSATAARSGKGSTEKKAVRSSPAELWRLVDKSLVEDLFDQLLRSFDDVTVSCRPEADETGSDGSRASPSANQRPSTVAGDRADDGGLCRAAAYKWKSHLLRRMRTQQSSTRDASLCRKRRYADRKLIQIT